MPVSIQPFIFFIFVSLFIVWHFFVLSPCSRGKLAICVCCSERTPRFYSLSSFMVPICTILKVLILVYMQNIPVLQQKRVKKIKIKKKMLQHHTYIFWTLYCCFTMCFNLRSEKKEKKQLWNKSSFYKMILDCVWESTLCSLWKLQSFLFFLNIRNM